MQRVRIGLTGLSIVFLLVLLAAAVFGLVQGEEREKDTAPAGNVAAVNSGNAEDLEKEPREPLAELGVTPGGPPEDAEADNAAALNSVTPPAKNP